MLYILLLVQWNGKKETISSGNILALVRSLSVFLVDLFRGIIAKDVK